MREITDQVTPEVTSYRQSASFAPALLSQVKDLPPASLDITPLDPVQMMARDLNFPSVTIGDGKPAATFAQDASAFTKSADQAAAPSDSSSVVPEQLDTGKGLTKNMVTQHLQKVADHFEQYSNKLLNVLNPHKGKSKEGGDNLTQSKCPFMRVANAVGMQYPKSGTSDGASKAG